MSGPTRAKADETLKATLLAAAAAASIFIDQTTQRLATLNVAALTDAEVNEWLAVAQKLLANLSPLPHGRTP